MKSKQTNKQTKKVHLDIIKKQQLYMQNIEGKITFGTGYNNISRKFKLITLTKQQ